MLISDACEKYLDAKRERLRATTMEGYESAIRRHIIPKWGDVELEEIDTDSIQEWVDSFNCH